MGEIHPDTVGASKGPEKDNLPGNAGNGTKKQTPPQSDERTKDNEKQMEKSRSQNQSKPGTGKNDNSQLPSDPKPGPSGTQGKSEQDPKIAEEEIQRVLDGKFDELEVIEQDIEEIEEGIALRKQRLQAANETVMREKWEGNNKFKAAKLTLKNEIRRLVEVKENNLYLQTALTNEVRRLVEAQDEVKKKIDQSKPPDKNPSPAKTPDHSEKSPLNK